MATSYGQIYQYRDPGQVDLSSTFKAQTYKQENYNQNVADYQRLVNQYVGTDLLRDVDKQYLGERLSTLVNYVKDSGTLDWSRKSIADEVSNYVGQALDSNVQAAIASTQRYRNHQMQMEELKAKKPELYATQNDWAATRDLNRYLSSDKLGDMYQQGSYTPYTDLNKLIEAGLPLLKEYGVQVTYSNDGNPLLTRIDKHEVLTEQESSQFLNMILGEKGNTQLAIDGLYKYRNASDVDVKSEYKGIIGDQLDSLRTQAKNYNILKTGMTDAQKSYNNQQYQALNEKANQLKDYYNKVDNLDKDQIAASMYTDRYKQNWSKLLAFDRVTDWKIDDRNFQVAKENADQAQKQWERNFQENKFLTEQTWKQKNYDLDLAKAMGSGKVSLDSNGNPNPYSGSGNSNEGITTSSNGTALNEEKTVLAEDVYDTYSQAWTDARDNTRAYINQLRQTDKGQNILREHYGNLADGDVDKLVFAMMRGDKDSQLRLSGIRDVMNKDESGRIALKSIENSISAYRQKERMTPLLNEALKGVNDITKTVMKADNIKGEFFGLSEKVVGKDGKLYNGTYIGQDFDKLNSQQKLGAQIGSISNRLLAGDIPESERSALNVLRKNLVAQLRDKTAREYYNNFEAEDKSGAWDSLTSQLSAAGQKARMGWNSLMKGIFNDDEDRQAYDDAKKTYDANTANARRYWTRAGQQIGDIFNRNYTYSDLASNDLKRNGKTIAIGKTSDGYNQSADQAYEGKIASSLKILNERLQDNNVFKLSNKTINLDTENKNVKKEYESWIKTQFDGEIQKDANVRLNVNSKDGTVTLTAPIKDGKEYELMTTSPISFNDLPNNLRSRVTTNSNFEYDAANNRNAGTIYARGQVYSSDNRINELYGDLEVNPTEKRASVQTMTQNVQSTIGQENYNKYKTEIDALIQTPVDLVAHPVDGVYVMDIKSGNKVLSRQVVGPTITNEQKDLIAEQRDKIAVDKILEHIRKTYNK